MEDKGGLVEGGGPDGTGGRDRFRLDNTIFGVSVRSSTSITKKMQVQGSDVYHWGFGYMRGRGDDGVGVCGPQIQILLITSDSVRFSSFGKTLFENEMHGNGCVTAMAVGQRQRVYSGVRMFTGNYLSSTPRELRRRGRT